MIDLSVRPAASSPAAGARRHWRDLWNRYRFAMCCLLLVGLPFATAPGLIISDTKFELAVDPGRFLSTSLSLWDPQQFGGLQDQAAGYLFPMGPFFELGHLLSVGGWVTQRLWLAALLVAAFAGVSRLAARLGIGGPDARAAAGLAYALSPMSLGFIGQVSGEFLQMAMLPWILIPLVRRDKPYYRQVAQSAVAVAACSGGNAASTIAVLVPAAIFVLTRNRPFRLLAWWAPAVALATLSWTVPLLLLGKYGVSIVPYTESGQVTTTATSLLNTLRGTEDWVTYLIVNGQPWRPLGFQLATDVIPAILGGLLIALGVAGLVSRGLPERRFLLISTLAGLVIITFGYLSSLGNPLDAHLIHVLNGPASPFRNLWKFDPMVRLPLALALAYLLTRAIRQVFTWSLAGLAFCGMIIPAFATGLASQGAFARVPAYWVQAAGWLHTHAGRQAVLVEPGAPFGQYLWGAPMDDVLQALTSADYAERNLSVVGSTGSERLLATIDQQLSQGAGSAGLTELMARMGVRYVLVRTDLIRDNLYGAWTGRLVQALDESPGITPVAQFGPPTGTTPQDDATASVDPPVPAVQIYQVAGAQPIATVTPAAGAVRVYGAPEALLSLADEGLAAGRPVLLNGDGAGLPAAGALLTDTLRRRVVNFGQLRTNLSPTLTATQPAATYLAAPDYLEPGWSRYFSVARYTGIADITASSSSSDITAFAPQWASGLQPWSVADGDPRTIWQSSAWTGPAGQWIQLGFTGPLDPGTVSVAFDDNAVIGPPVTRVTVSTAAGSVSDPVAVTSGPQSLRVPRGRSTWLRITVTATAYRPSGLGSQVGIISIDVPGMTATRSIVAPAVPADPAAVVLTKTQPQPASCMRTAVRWVCSPSLYVPAEEQYGFDHTFSLQASQRAYLTGHATLVNGPLADLYARGFQYEASVTASSVYTSDPQDQPRSAFDGDPTTSWISSPADQYPKLTIKWGFWRRVTHVTIGRPANAAGTMQVLITGAQGQRRGGYLGPSGVISFAPMTTTSLTFTFTPVQGPVQISDVIIPGVSHLVSLTGSFRLPCGLGPVLDVNGQSVRTRVSGTFADLVDERPMTFTACDPVTLAAWQNEVTEPSGDAFSVQDVVVPLRGAARVASLAGGTVPARILSWSASRRTVAVDAAAQSYLVVDENYNPGWVATAGGRQLQPVRLDGWKQAWLLPTGTKGVVTLAFKPERVYRDAVIGGLGAIVLLMLLAVGRVSRSRLRRVLSRTRRVLAVPSRALSVPSLGRRVFPVPARMRPHVSVPAPVRRVSGFLSRIGKGTPMTPDDFAVSPVPLQQLRFGRPDSEAASADPASAPPEPASPSPPGPPGPPGPPPPEPAPRPAEPAQAEPEPAAPAKLSAFRRLFDILRHIEDGTPMTPAEFAVSPVPLTTLGFTPAPAPAPALAPAPAGVDGAASAPAPPADDAARAEPSDQSAHGAPRADQAVGGTRRQGWWPTPRLARGWLRQPSAYSRLIVTTIRRRLVPRRRLVMLVGYFVILAGAGLLLGGYTGAVLVPAATVMFGIRRRGWRHLARPGVLAGLVLAATAVGAAGEHQVLSGDIGNVVSAQVNAIPQVVCLIVFAGLAAALVRPSP